MMPFNDVMEKRLKEKGPTGGRKSKTETSSDGLLSGAVTEVWDPRKRKYSGWDTKQPNPREPGLEFDSLLVSNFSDETLDDLRQLVRHAIGVFEQQRNLLGVKLQLISMNEDVCSSIASMF